MESFEQNVVVMRHGERMDLVEPLWITRDPRPWDPPLTEDGKIKAWTTGRKIRNTPGLRIDRVFVSPFLRCVQTASRAVSALCAVGDGSDVDPLLIEVASDDSAATRLDPSKIKVSIEYGLCEILCKETIGQELVPRNGNWTLDVSQLEAKLPAGTVDNSVERIYKQLPQWEEPLEVGRIRYRDVILALADKFPHENLLLVTHGEAVGVAVSAFLEDMVVYDVDFCAYSHLQRRVNFKPNQSFTAEEFQVLSNTGQTGVCYYSTNDIPLLSSLS
ncbi:hypothetical protein QJS10_CPB20g01428 [Acorus calamus]|uniref:Phosphoglycerate mutase family protein n=1 Tax=Acorus calamus TaxID=4465 RepID=A0AAV9C936_ACOCL|nr:hypothetical protein QJS10_CPB20g01428 [Acorus calamus]